MNNRMAWTPERKRAFLDALRANGGNVTAAAAAVSPHSEAQRQPGYSSIRRILARDPEFSAQVQEVLEAVKDDVFAEIYRRAMKGTEEGVYGKGQRIFEPVLDGDGEIVRDSEGNPKMRAATIRRLDNRLLLRLAARLDPSWSESVNPRET